jgi:hypothetical protein
MSDDPQEVNPAVTTSGNVFQGNQFPQFRIETPEELRARINRETLDASSARDIRERDRRILRWIIGGTVAFLLFIGTVAGWYAFIRDGIDETARANASAIVTTIVAGLVGAIAGYLAAPKA